MIKHKQSGISLLELMLSLVVIVAILVVATRYYQTTRQSQQVDEAVTMVEAVITAANAWLESGPWPQPGETTPPGSHCTSPTQNMICTFIATGLLPANFNTVNPWGGGVTATPEGAGSSLAISIILDGINTTACTDLQEKFSQRMSDVGVATCSSGSFQIDVPLEQLPKSS